MTKDEKIHVDFMITEIERDMGEKDFQMDFFISLCDQFKKRKSLSEKQYEAMKNIYERVTG